MGIRVSVRDAGPDDAEALAELWKALLTESRSFARVSSSPSPDAVRRRLAEIAGRTDRRLLVAVLDGAVAGAVYVAREPITPLHEACSVRISYLRVFDRYRRRSVGHALLEAATAWATEIGVEHILVDVPPGARESNRYFARLGLAPFVAQRAAAASLVRRRLAAIRSNGDDLGLPPWRRPRNGGVLRSRPFQRAAIDK